MPSLKQIRTRIKAIKSISKVTKTMELISAIKFQKYLKYLEYSEAYLSNLHEQLQVLLSDLNVYNTIGDKEINSIIELKEDNTSNLSTEIEKIGNIFILIGSDKGLNGEFMSALKKYVSAIVDKNKNSPYIVLGQRLFNFVKKKNINLLRDQTLMDFGNIDGTVEEIFKELINKEINICLESQIVFVKFQKPGKLLVKQDYIFDQNLIYLILNTKKTGQEVQTLSDLLKLMQINLKSNNLLTEPNLTEIIKLYLVNLAKAKIYNAILNTFVSENFSRMLFMKNATQNANDIQDMLTLNYNKTRQEIITREISEIVAGSLGNQTSKVLSKKYIKIYVN